MAIEWRDTVRVTFTMQEAMATYRLLKSAERKAEAEWRADDTEVKRRKFETLESARIRVARVIRG